MPKNTSEERNQERGERAYRALQFYIEEDITDEESVVRDFLTDLMHAMNNQQLDDPMVFNFEHELEVARRAYADEIADELRELQEDGNV